jgi:branched-chain amino acid transport system ATP-binding protein
MSDGSGLVVETRGLGVSFGGVHAVDTVDFALHAGELRCLIGPNGAGKSTFFKLLTGQYRPTRGHIAIHGQATAGMDTYRIARIGVGIKTQVPSVFNALSVRENIWVAARRRFRGADTDGAVDDVLERLELGAVAAQAVGTLSHGQRQWVELGMVLASRPTLVLLDEPAAGMSDDEVARTATLIRRMNEHCAVIVVEHDMAFIRMIAKTVTVFNRGRILVEDTVERVLADPRVRDVYLGKELGAPA